MQLSSLRRGTELQDPPWYRALFSSTAAAPLWLLVRVYVGWQWLHGGWEKVTGDGWVNGSGAALQAFWTRIVVIPDDGRPAISYGWYRDFIQFMLDREWYSWFAPLVAYGEVLVGIGLIVGGLTAVAALFGATLNFNFMLAGSASTNPVLFLLAILLILAWKVAGQIGIDRWLLPALGTPWSPGPSFTTQPPGPSFTAQPPGPSFTAQPPGDTAGAARPPPVAGQSPGTP